MKESEIRREIQELFHSQKLAVVATNMNGLPYTNLIAFVATDDLKNIAFATLTDTRKYQNLIRNDKITILIDNRSNKPSDFYEAVAVCAEGTAEILINDKNNLKSLFIEKHPYLKEFVESKNCVMIQIDVEKYHFVSRFQNVSILVLKK